MNNHSRPSILALYPSSYYYPDWAGRDQIKSAQLTLASYMSQYFPVEYADLEIDIGRPQTRVQVRRFERRAKEILAGKKFDILAISCWTSLCYKATLTAARAARELNPDCLVVVGGYHPTACPDDFLTEDNAVDYVIRGEGELALTEIARGYATAGRPPETKVVISPPLPPEEYADINWDLIDYLARGQFADGFNTMCIFLSRGCPYRCSFCMELIKEPFWRPMEPAQAIEQVRAVGDRYHPLAVAFGDACFGVKREWRKDFLSRLTDLAPDYWLLFETRPDFLDDEDIELLSNFKVQIQLGLESASPRMLQIMNKTKNPEKYLEKFQEVSHRLSEFDIVHGANLIFNHPGDTMESVRETFAFMDRELARGTSSLIWACHDYAHFPGSEIDLHRDKYEREYGSQFLRPEWWKVDEDQFDGSRQVIPSSDIGAEGKDHWRKMISEREKILRETLSPIAFRIAADTYWPQWQNDPRYAEVPLP